MSDTTAADASQAADSTAFSIPDRSAMTSLKYLSQTDYKYDYSTKGYTVGGLSGIDYDPTTKTFISESDHGKNGQATHYFTLQANFAAGKLGYDLDFTGATKLGPDDIESIRYDPSGNGIWFTTEGTPPRIYHLQADGNTVQTTVPANIATRSGGNTSLEGSTFTPDGQYVVSMEDALKGDADDLTRITQFNQDGTVAAQYAYKLEKGGVSEILALSDTKFLVMERSFDGTPQTTPPVSVSHNSVRIYEIDTSAATDVQNVQNLADGGNFTAVTKSKILDSASLASTLNTYTTKIDNMEGMTFGPKLADGHDSLVLVNDDNYNETEGKTQFLVFEVQTSVPAAQYWDGAGPMADGLIGGGTGTWSANAATENWARTGGMVNDAWNGGTAVFSGPSGTVSIDTSAGAVSAGELDFQSDGYDIVGGTLTMGAGGLIVNAAAATHATLDAPLDGSGALTLTGSGTLVLSGPNTYTGGSVIEDGTLEIGAAGAGGTGAIGFEAGAGDTATLLLDGKAQPKSGGTFGNALDGFGTGDSLDLAGLAYSGRLPATALTVAGDKLTVTEKGGSESFTLGGSHQAVYYAHSDGHGGTLIEATPCYARGTKVLTERGEVAVEDLAVGDRVVLASGGSRPVVWLGHRATDCSTHPEPQKVWPVCVAAGAFGEGLPVRDLWLSPDHCVAVDGALIPVKALVNGRTVAQRRRPRVEYWHVELDRHDVILAEGLPAESYLDTGNRAAFANGGVFVALHPDFAPRHAAETCLPLVMSGRRLERARLALLGRAEALGCRLVAEADPHLVADGQAIELRRLGESRIAFALPPDCGRIVLRSRLLEKAAVGAGRDGRSLGLCITRMKVDGVLVPLDQGGFGVGWHAAERLPDGSVQRWTDGEATLPAGARHVVLDLGAEGLYWDEDDSSRSTVTSACG